MPTIQGIMRRGVNVEALKNFILKQGSKLSSRGLIEALVGASRGLGRG